MSLLGFEGQAVLWLTAAGASAIAFLQQRKANEDAGRLPEACRFDDLHARIASAEEALAALRPQVEAAHAAVASRDVAKAEEEQARKWLADAREQLLTIEGERQRQENLRQELAALQEKASQTQASFDRLSAESARLTSEIASLTERRDAVKREIDGAEEHRKGVAQAVEALEEKQRLTRLAATEVEESLARSRSALGEVTRQLDECTRKSGEARRQLESLEHDIGRLSRERAVAEQDAVRAKQQLQALEQRIADLERRTQEFKLRADEAEAGAQAAAGRAKRAEAEAIEAVGRRDMELKRLAEVKKQVSDEDARLAGIRSEHDRLRAERDGLVATIASLKAIAESLRKDLDKQGAAPANDRFQDLWTPLPFPALPPRDRSWGEQEALQSTALYIDQQGLKFPPRVLHAFHTALKVNAISPLVVLAGISGTGKSELPRRYAEGMGMHFVPLAVQPRWDSPQDLFGFYNYLEHRYKATELARALVQFERFNRESWPLPKGWNHSRGDRLLLVLLDEMNLARVEYYFSEFLSKLETRRGIRRDVPSERAKAEIVLETGSIREQEQPLRLFPDNNVLFTGTMNEDESTQTLSDKVLDRACVLRFGRPKKVNPAFIGARTAPTEKGLTVDCWNKWYQDPAAAKGELGQVDQWIGDLNDAMEAIGRPFGHRVAQAVQAYVANYPRWVPGRLGTAMADQIEQRILPKLRGVDVDEHRPALEKIKTVIETCDDALLKEAFHRGYDGQSTFIWRGLDRSER